MCIRDRPNTVNVDGSDAFEYFEVYNASNQTVDLKDYHFIYVNGTKETEWILEGDIQLEAKKTLTAVSYTHLPAPLVDEEGGLQFQPALLDYNEYVGRIGIGRIQRGKVKVNETVVCLRADGTKTQFRVQKLFGFLGLHRIEIEEASAGDIVAIAGLADIGVGETVCTMGHEEPLPLLRIDEPTIQMVFGTNTSPFAGKEGKFVTASKVEERLFKETNRDVSLKIERVPNAEEWIVSGRGELHLSLIHISPGIRV